MGLPRLLFLVVAAAGCNTPTYLGQHRPLETLPDAMGGGNLPDTDLFVMPVRRPSADERAALRSEAQSRGLMMPVPWAGRRDFAVEIEWSMKNLETSGVVAYLSLNGGNEFGDYVPALYIDKTANPEDQTPPPPLLGGQPIALGAGQITTGVFREDQIDEAALDLEAITRYPAPEGVLATPFQVISHLSSQSSTGFESIPANDVTPQMVRYQFLLSANGHVVVDYNVRVRDRGDKISTPGARGLYVSTAAMLTPPVVPP
jgi:hypothetical protein